MNQACARNDTIDASNHHGRPQYRPQYRPFLRFLTTQERNVIWLLLAIAFLPVDGTTLGLYAPFWSPISPALFAVYCLCNWRQLRIAANRYLPMFLLPVACIILSIPGWLKFGIHLNAAFMSITGLLGVLATLGAIAIAFGIKRIPWRTPLRILIASYWFSFGVGVVQWLSIHLHIKPLTDYFAHLMYRQYINESSVWGGGRPQFLFAEPSYIGMHLFGVLLPLMWLMRGLCQAVAQPHRCVCDWRCANAGRHPDRSSRESTRVLTRYAGCSPIRGRCLPDMAPATSSTRYGPARSTRDDC